MPVYQTQYVLGLSTGKPITLRISESALERMEWQKALAKDGHGSPFIGRTAEEVTIGAEFSFFPVYQEVLKIGFASGFTNELITQILREFGATTSLIQKLLHDDVFNLSVRPFFESVTNDGGRAIRTLMIVYNTAVDCSREGQAVWDFATELQPIALLNG